jgi:hypothetical protein
VRPSVEFIDRAIQAAEAGERADLVARLQQNRRRLLDPRVRVLVVGEFKQGKSLLVNALVTAPVCPVDDDVATAVPTVVSHGEQPSAALVWLANPNGHRIAETAHPAEPDYETVPVALEDLDKHVSEAADRGTQRRLVRAEITLPRAILARGLVLVDTPGVGGLGSMHAIHTLAELPMADAVLLVSDAGQEYTQPEIDFLRQAMKLCPNVACVLTKTDLYPHWRRIAELDRMHLSGAGVEAPLLPVSSTVRLHAVRTEDKEVNAESGFEDLLSYLATEVIDKAALLSRRSVANDLLTVTDQLSVPLRAELAAQQDPENNQAVIAELEKARGRAEDLKRRTAKWQQTLNDGVNDLVADIDYDLRDRLRVIIRDGEEAIDEADPGPMWEQFSEWLDQRVAAAVADNFVWANQRAEWLAGQVSDHFAESGDELLPRVQIADTDGVLDRIDMLEEVESGKLGIGTKTLIGMRGSYGGVLMIGVITVLAGMASLINPISIGAGLLLGVKSYRDDKDSRLKRRRQEAKMALRRHVDEVGFQVGKESKDRLRAVQRLLRDHFTSIAEELTTSLTGAVNAAQKAAKTKSSDREQRIRDLRNELDRIELIQKRARALVEPVGAPA